MRLEACRRPDFRHALWALVGLVTIGIATGSPAQERGTDMGEFLRPKAEILPDRALIPAPNLISPPPDQFTHELTRDQPYFYSSPAPSGADGTLPIGTRVLLMRQEGSRCRVVDARGLYVEIDCGGLRRL
jgi:hypothetical protein